MEMRAFLLKMMLSPLLVGTVNLAKTMPARQACMMTPKMLWVHMTTMAKGHSSVVALDRERENPMRF